MKGPSTEAQLLQRARAILSDGLQHAPAALKWARGMVRRCDHLDMRPDAQKRRPDQQGARAAQG